MLLGDMQDPLDQKWQRVPSFDSMAEGLAQKVSDGDLRSLYLGDSSDSLPLFAFSPNAGCGLPLLLIIAAGSGDSVLSPPAAVSILQQGGVEGYETWVICALDAPRLRHNEGQLGDPTPGLREHAMARRVAWGEWEDPESNLPIEYQSLWQPDQITEQWPEGAEPCSLEALALARALVHLSPQLVISLRDIAAGGVSFASSQPLATTDWERLLGAVQGGPLGVYQGPKLLSGSSVQGQPGCLIMHSLEGESDRAAKQESLSVGGVNIAQFMQLALPNSLYLRIMAPRLWAPELSNASPSTQTRSITTVSEIRLSGGEDKNRQITLLDNPGHPSHQAEVSSVITEILQPEVSLENQPALKSWLAIEAFCERRETISSALRSWQEALSHMEGADHDRGMQVLQSRGETGPEIRAAQSNKAMQNQASAADWVYWNEVYRYQTVLILAEAIRCLRQESRTDPKIKDLRTSLEELADQQLSFIRSLSPVEGSEISKMLAKLTTAAAVMAARGGAELIRCKARLAKAEQNAFDARKAARTARHLRLDPSDKKAAEAESAAYATALMEAQSEYAKLVDLIGDDAAEPEPIAPTAPPELPPVPVAAEPPPSTEAQPETVPDLPPVPAAAELPPSIETHAEPAPDLPPVPAAAELPLSTETQEGPEPALPAASAQPHDVPLTETAGPNTASVPAQQQVAEPALSSETPEASSSKLSPDDFKLGVSEVDINNPESWLTGPDQGKVEPRSELDIERLLPKRLELPREWGRGAISWSDQIPRLNQPPLMRRLARHLLQHSGQIEVPAEIAELEPRSTAMQPAVIDSQPISSARPTGWLRSRSELNSRYQPPVAASSETPPVSGGQWRSFRRSCG